MVGGVGEEEAELGLVQQAGVLDVAHGGAHVDGLLRETVGLAHQGARAALFAAPVEEGRREVGLDREPEIGGLDIVARGQTAGLGGEGLHTHPVADVLDDRVGVDQVEAVVRVLGQGAGVAVDIVEQGRVHGVEAAWIDQGDVDLVGVEEVAWEQVPVFRLAAQIDDPHSTLLGVDGLDQRRDAPGAGAAKTRHQRVGVGVVLKGVDQFHDAVRSGGRCVPVNLLILPRFAGED
ncbi:hypothetical protein D3C86_1579000 [compost metagenome]